MKCSDFSTFGLDEGIGLGGIMISGIDEQIVHLGSGVRTLEGLQDHVVRSQSLY